MEIRPSEKSIQDQQLSKDKVSEKQSFSQKAISKVRGFFNRSNAGAEKVLPVIDSVLKQVSEQRPLMPTAPFSQGFESRRSFDAAQWNANGGQTSRYETSEKQKTQPNQEAVVNKSDENDEGKNVTINSTTPDVIVNSQITLVTESSSPRDIIKAVAAGNSVSVESSQTNEGLIPGDLEVGLRKIIDEDLPNSIKLGVMMGIRSAGNNFSQGITLVASAIESDVELTPQAKENLKNEIRQKVALHLPEGIQTTINTTLYQVENGRETGLTSGARNIDQIFDVAQELGIEIAYVPKELQEKSSESGIVPSFTTREEVKAYLEDRIDKQLITGIKGKIDRISYLVSTGNVDKLDEEKKEMDDWITLLDSRGFTIVDEPVTEKNDEADENPNALVERKINRTEVQQLVDEQIKNNLAKGLAERIAMIRFRLKEGYNNPLQGSSKNDIAALEALGEKYGVLSRDISTLTDGINFNPDLFEGEVKKAVAESVPSGLKNKVNLYGLWIQDGHINLVPTVEKTIGDYIALAKEHDIPVNEEEVRQDLKNAVTRENIQKGVDAVRDNLRDNIRNGNFYLLRLAGSNISQLRQFAYKHGVTDIDFSEVEQYMKDHGVSSPELTA